jgi:hypothetical protein
MDMVIPGALALDYDPDDSLNGPFHRDLNSLLKISEVCCRRKKVKVIFQSFRFPIK